MSSATHKAVLLTKFLRWRFQGGLGSIWYPALNVHRKGYGKNPGLAVCLNHKWPLVQAMASLLVSTRTQNAK